MGFSPVAGDGRPWGWTISLRIEQKTTSKNSVKTVGLVPQNLEWIPKIASKKSAQTAGVSCEFDVTLTGDSFAG